MSSAALCFAAARVAIVLSVGVGTWAIAANSSDGAAGPVIDGEHFTLRSIVDRQQGGLTVSAFMAPAGWSDRSQVIWNYAHTSNPVTAAVNVENPANQEAFYLYPSLDMFWLRPEPSQFGNGQEVGGLLHIRPMQPAATLTAFVQQVRHGYPNLRFIGSKDLPDLPAALHVPPSPGQRGVGVKVAYDKDGRPVEEEFYGIYYSVDIPYDGPQGRTWQRNWGLRFLHSFRAPRGGLDARRPIFAAIAKSFRPNPVWVQRQNAINAYLAEQFNRQLQAGYDQIAAAGRLSQQISANNDSMLASIDAKMQASRSGRVAGEAERSATDKFDDYIRGVTTTDDPYHGTSQHSSNESYHWTDGYGGYRNSNDPSYNPGQNENGNWTLMPESR